MEQHDQLEHVKVGDVFRESWGYDQTNVDFYEVVSRTRCTVKVRQIRSRLVDAASNVTHVVPDHGNFRDDTDTNTGRSGLLTKRLRMGYKDVPTITITSYSNAHLWNGTPAYETASGWGH